MASSLPAEVLYEIVGLAVISYMDEVIAGHLQIPQDEEHFASSLEDLSVVQRVQYEGDVRLPLFRVEHLGSYGVEQFRCGDWCWNITNPLNVSVGRVSTVARLAPAIVAS